MYFLDISTILWYIIQYDVLLGGIMKITGVVSEYNPFHMGHEYQIKKARELSSCDGIAVVMSGNFVQRGEPAIIDKFRRAEAAVRGGADLVIELPFPFSCQNAEMFAGAAIRELKKLNISALSFGCESSDIKMLKDIARLQLSSVFNTEVKEEIKSGTSYPKALSKVISSHLGEYAFTLSGSPNNVLAIEYIKSTIVHNLNLDLIPVKRMGKDHNDLSATGSYDSATAIRKVLLSSDKHNVSVTADSMEMLRDFHSEHKSFNSFNRYLQLLYYKILELGPDGLNEIYEVSEGLNNKIYANVFKHENIDDFIASLKSKRYTYSKLRRMLLNIILGIRREDMKGFMLFGEVSPVKVLAFNDVGRRIMREAKESGTAVINRYSDYRKYGLNAEELPTFSLTNKATNIYYLTMENKYLNYEYTANARYIKI